VRTRAERSRAASNGASFEELLARTQEFFGDLAIDFLRRPIEGLLRRVLGRVTKYAVAAALLGLGAALLLWAAAEGLIALGTPAYAAHAAAGALSIAAAWFLIQSCRRSDER
jgi:hypothetical protein